MKSQYQKNYTPEGYLMNYIRGHSSANCKKRVLLFQTVLREIEPPIWREFIVPSDYNFWDLHVAIQDAMGWLDYHLHHFEIRKRHRSASHQIGIPSFTRIDEDAPEVFPGWEIPVVFYYDDLGVTAKYLYDYGDGWEMDVLLKGYILRDKSVKYPICTGGARACPPEDCGGVSGYQNLLETLSNPKNDDYQEMKNWAGIDWAPGKFDGNMVKFDDPRKRWRYAFPTKPGS